MNYNRKIYSDLESHLSKKEIMILVGPRQVGKTTLMKMIKERIKNKNQTFWFDLDNIDDSLIFEKLSILENYLIGKGVNLEKKVYLFVDEFQTYKNSTILFKNIYDKYDNIKIIASGSSSMKIKNKIQESLAGRKKIFYIYPLDFEEFLDFKNNINSNSINEKNIELFQNLDKISGKNLDIPLKTLIGTLREFMIFGGYPNVVLEKNLEEKKDVLSSIFDLYLKKDIVDFLKIEKISAIKKFIQILAVNNGQNINLIAVSSQVGVTFNTLKDYLEILEETYIIKQVKPYYTNKFKEIVKSPKIYFVDPGVRNYFINNFNNLDLRNDGGFLYETYFLAELLKQNIGYDIKYWREKGGKEVDFIIDKLTSVIPIEIKYKNSLKAIDLSGLNEFIKIYNDKIEKVYLLNLGIQEEYNKIEGKVIKLDARACL